MNDDDVVKTFYVNRVHERIEKEMREAGRISPPPKNPDRFVADGLLRCFKESDPRPEVQRKIRNLARSVVSCV